MAAKESEMESKGKMGRKSSIETRKEREKLP